MANKSKSRNRRPQTPKPRNKRMNEGMLELRQGSRTTPIPSGTTYNRNDKSWKKEIR